MSFLLLTHRKETEHTPVDLTSGSGTDVEYTIVDQPPHPTIPISLFPISLPSINFDQTVIQFGYFVIQILMIGLTVYFL